MLRASRQADLFGDYEAIFADYGINCAIVTTGTTLASRLGGDPGMARVFADSDRQVFVRTERDKLGPLSLKSAKQ